LEGGAQWPCSYGALLETLGATPLQPGHVIEFWSAG
jgi:hypothetical protein